MSVLKENNILIIFGLSDNEAAWYSFGLRYVWQGRRLKFCASLRALEDTAAAMCQSCRMELVVNTSLPLYELELVFSRASELGIQIAGAVSTGKADAGSLKLCRKRGVPVILCALHSEDELLFARKAVQEGRSYTSKGIFISGEENKTTGGITLVSVPVPCPAEWTLLSSREKSCCRGILSSKIHKEIATDLQIQKTTVDSYCSRILHKFSVQTELELFAKFIPAEIKKIIAGF